mgnify:CR=1 FL=1
MTFKQRSTGSPLEFKQMGSSPAKHGTNPKGDAPHTKFKTETEHEEYHDVHPTKDLNKAEIKGATKPKSKIGMEEWYKEEEEETKRINP